MYWEVIIFCDVFHSMPVLVILDSETNLSENSEKKKLMDPAPHQLSIWVFPRQTTELLIIPCIKFKETP